MKLKHFLKNTSSRLSQQQRPHTPLLPPLEIVNNDIVMHDEPFRHIVVDDLLTDTLYEDLCCFFADSFSRGLSEKPDRNLFSRHQGGYDAYIFTPNPRAEYPMSFLNSRGWVEYLSSLFAIQSSDDTITSFHHHLPSGADGWVHSDYSLCSFREDRLDNGINPWYYQCIYEDDVKGRQPDTTKRMRAIAIIYYLANEPWKEGDGGETALYNKEQNIVKKVAPINNRLLAFEISPTSFHGFVKNHRHIRNSISQWIHQEPQSMFEKFGVYETVKWK